MAFWTNDKSTLELDLAEAVREIELADAVVRANSPATATG